MPTRPQRFDQGIRSGDPARFAEQVMPAVTKQVIPFS
jgi:hypothetical protein